MDYIRIFYRQNKKTIDKLLTIIILFLCIFLFMKYLFALLIPFVIGFIISLFTTPISKFINNKIKINKGLSTILAIVIFISVIGLVGTYLFYIIKGQLEDMYLNLDTYTQNFSDFIVTITNLLDTIFFLIPDLLTNTLNDFLENIIPAIISSLGIYAKDVAIKIVGFIPKLVVYTFIGFISSYFITRDKELIKKTIGKCIPQSFNKKLIIIGKSLNTAVLGYIKAQGILMCFTGFIAITGLTIFGYPYGLLVGIVIAIIDAIPFFGSGFILWPWAAYYMVSGEFTRGVILFVLYGTILITRQIMEPKILGNQIGLHPLITLMSVFIGASTMGVLGIFLGPISVVICKAIWESELT